MAWERARTAPVLALVSVFPLRENAS